MTRMTVRVWARGPKLFDPPQEFFRPCPQAGRRALKTPPNLTASRERICNSASYLGIISAKSNRSPISVKYVTQPKASTC